MVQLARADPSPKTAMASGTRGGTVVQKSGTSPNVTACALGTGNHRAQIVPMTKIPVHRLSKTIGIGRFSNLTK